jgi:sec-independent protein translocase protein TatA
MSDLALIGGPEIWIILAVVLLLFGARKLPELARSLGSSVTEFRKGLKDGDEPKSLDAPERGGPGEGKPR